MNVLLQKDLVYERKIIIELNNLKQYISIYLERENIFWSESFESLETSFVPFLQEPSHTTLSTPDTSRLAYHMNIPEVAPKKGIFVPS